MTIECCCGPQAPVRMAEPEPRMAAFIRDPVELAVGGGRFGRDRNGQAQRLGHPEEGG
jgi:hypothetical protein